MANAYSELTDPQNNEIGLSNVPISGPAEIKRSIPSMKLFWRRYPVSQQRGAPHLVSIGFYYG